MAELENYVTKTNPTLEDWIDYNAGLFTALQTHTNTNETEYAPFVDVDRHAAEAGVTTEAYFETVRSRVGSLGRAGLQLVNSEMDGAWHIIVAPSTHSIQS